MVIQLWASQAVGANHHQCSSTFTIQSNTTGVICRVVTPKDKERYPSPLTKQKENSQMTGDISRSVTPKDRGRKKKKKQTQHDEKTP